MNTTPPDLPDSAYDLGFAGPSAQEQLTVELINRARLDPAGEAVLQGTPLASGVSSTPSQALAVVPELDRAAEGHSKDMLEYDFFAHDSPIDGQTPFDRMRDEGYFYRAAGENLGYIGSFDNALGTGRVNDHQTNLWNSPGHQRNLMNGTYTEVGIGYEIGEFNGFQNASMVTQKFGDRGHLYLTGVVVDDADGDRFYDIGEGQGDVRITAWDANDVYATATWDAGGYSLRLDPGTYTVHFEGGDLDGSYTTEVTITDQNVKLDVFEGETAGDAPVPDSPAEPPVDQPSFVLSDTSDTFDGTDGDDMVLAGAGNDTVSGLGGGDTIRGEGGADRLFGRSGNDDLSGGDGADLVAGGDGNDMLSGDGANDTLKGHGGEDRISGGSGDDTAHGGGGDDEVAGDGGGDTLRGGVGGDLIQGGDGDDVLGGGVGNDTLEGGAGNDTLKGSWGNDTLTGGTGADIFHFKAGHGSDVITDFEVGTDLIKINAAGADAYDDLTITDTADGARIAFDDVVILVEDTAAAALTADVFQIA